MHHHERKQKSALTRRVAEGIILDTIQSSFKGTDHARPHHVLDKNDKGPKRQCPLLTKAIEENLSHGLTDGTIK